WQRVRFGDVVENLNETCEPEAAGLERFIGLEHLEPGSLHIRAWGNVADGTTFTRRCRPGQVLFGKRRAYQRKVAVAEFDAVVSGDIYVLAPKGDRLLPELLPFLCLSERFFQHAVGTSAGSLSPRTNWSSLASFEFDLPPLDQQRRIAEILWAVDEVEQTQQSAECSTASYLNAVVEAELGKMFEGPCEALSGLWPESPDSGCSAPPSTVETGHFVLSLTALSETGYLRGNLKPVKPTDAMLAARLSKGDFLISRSNTQELVGLVGIYDEERDDVSFPDTMMRLHVDENKVSKRFLELVLSSSRGRKHMMRSAAGTSGSMKKINRQTLGQCLVPTPSFAKQDKILEEATRIRSALRELEVYVASTQSLKLAITNSIIT
ncbi:MAG: restriction endonuclease subunit S, partial [Verrucomicrobia bacterium]|nr:restriction endonuclease subunit S [Verrucomicrobiota bacterium]